MVIAGVSWVFCGLAGSGVFDCVTYRSLSYQPTIFLRVCVCVCGSMMMTASEWSTSYSYFQLLQYWTASIDPANDELLIINAIPYTICYVLRAMMLLSHSGKIEAKLQERIIITMKTRSRREREKKNVIKIVCWQIFCCIFRYSRCPSPCVCLIKVTCAADLHLHSCLSHRRLHTVRLQTCSATGEQEGRPALCRIATHGSAHL